jgi:glutathione peroxidase
MEEKGFYDFSALSLAGDEISMGDYHGKVVVAVNTASKCGFTKQLAGLQSLYEKYADRGLVILGFPCNQFGGQEPGTEAEIAAGCVINYGVTFQMMSKIKVNGKEAHPLYLWLKERLKGPLGARVAWNFTKFVLDRTGEPVRRFEPRDTPEAMEEYVAGLL